MVKVGAVFSYGCRPGASFFTNCFFAAGQMHHLEIFNFRVHCVNFQKTNRTSWQSAWLEEFSCLFLKCGNFKFLLLLLFTTRFTAKCGSFLHFPDVFFHIQSNPAAFAIFAFISTPNGSTNPLNGSTNPLNGSTNPLNGSTNP